MANNDLVKEINRAMKDMHGCLIVFFERNNVTVIDEEVRDYPMTIHSLLKSEYAMAVKNEVIVSQRFFHYASSHIKKVNKTMRRFINISKSLAKRGYLIAMLIQKHPEVHNDVSLTLYKDKPFAKKDIKASQPR